MATTDWKGSLPLTLFLFAVAALFFSNAPVSFGDSFLGNIVIGTAWFLLVPLMAGAGVKKAVNAWFVRAGAFAFTAAAFVLVGGTFLDLGTIWSGWLVEIGIILSWLMAGIGGLVALGTTK